MIRVAGDMGASMICDLAAAIIRDGKVPSGGWSGGAKVLGKISVPGRPTSLDDSRASVYCACNRCGWGLFGHFFSHLSFSLFFLPLFGRRPDID